MEPMGLHRDFFSQCLVLFICTLFSVRERTLGSRQRGQRKEWEHLAKVTYPAYFAKNEREGA